MRKLKTSDWLLTLAAALGLAATASAQDNGMVRRADAILSGPERSLVEQISHECAPGGPLCDSVPCDGFGCDSIGCDSCYLFDTDFSLQSLLGECSPINIGGWTQIGYHNRSAGVGGAAFNNRPHNLALHQQWLYAEKVADGSNGWDWGFRADFMYGIDADDTQAFGNNPGNWDFENGWDRGSYGFAMPQLYGEIAFGDWSIIAGHFYTLLGYEVVTAPDNFFYSHAFTMYNSEAFTHTGMLATYQASDNVEVYAGWTLGWDTGFNQRNGGSSFLGGISVGLTDDLTATFITTIGNFGDIGDGYSHSIVLDWALTDRINYVFQSDVLRADVYDTVGLNQYLFYTINDCWKVGGRAEWWKEDGISMHALTAGVNYRPTQNLVLRPEIRYQWAPSDANPLDTNRKAIFGVDAILTY